MAVVHYNETARIGWLIQQGWLVLLRLLTLLS